jgi:glycosyltransferase involved in cell wall biosynthesis
MTPVALLSPAPPPLRPLGSPTLEGFRLAVFTDTYAPHLNGVTRTLERLVAEVERRGGVARVFTVEAPGRPRPPAVRWPSVPFWAYPEMRLAWPGAARAKAELRAFQPTLVHAATPLGIGLAGRAAARALGVPLVSSYHTSLTAYARHYRLGALVEPGWRFLRWFHAGALRTYCPTRAVASELAARGFPRLAIWGRGVDTARFSPAHRSEAFRARLGVRRGEVLATYVGRLAAEKDLDVLLDAMRLLGPPERSGIRLVLVGEGPHEAACRARAPAGTVFTGRLEGGALAEAYASADLFAFPSRTDTFGNVLVEAMASGLPVLAADVPQTREVLGGAGHLFPAGSASALVGLLLRLARDPVARARASAGGLEAAGRFAWDEIFDELFRDYLAVAGPHGAHVARALGPVPSLRVAT